MEAEADIWVILVVEHKNALDFEEVLEILGLVFSLSDLSAGFKFRRISLEIRAEFTGGGLDINGTVRNSTNALLTAA